MPTLIAPQPPEASASVPEARSSENSAMCSQPSRSSAGLAPHASIRSGMEEPGAARHQQVDALVVAPVAGAVEQVHVAVLVGELEVGGPRLHAAKVDRFRLGPMSFLRRCRLS